MSDNQTIVKVPLHTDMNTGLSVAHASDMISLLGVPGKLTRNCSRITNKKLSSRTATINVGPFRATGLILALSSLQEIFKEVLTKDPDLYHEVSTEGMSCVRAIRNANTFSIHSWGTAIDLKYGELDQYGSTTCRKGLLKLYPFFHKYGWYWEQVLMVIERILCISKFPYNFFVNGNRRDSSSGVRI